MNQTVKAAREQALLDENQSAGALSSWRIAWKIGLTVTNRYIMTWKWTKRPNKKARPKTGFNHPTVAVCNRSYDYVIQHVKPAGLYSISS